jgi:hypothetical protein
VADDLQTDARRMMEMAKQRSLTLAEPRQLFGWLLPTIDQGTSSLHPFGAALIDLGLIALFGLQHSVMARPWFKKQVMRMPAAFERCTFVHMANFSLFR